MIIKRILFRITERFRWYVRRWGSDRKIIGITHEKKTFVLPLVVAPKVTLLRTSMKRMNKMLPIGHRVRGDVLVEA